MRSDFLTEAVVRVSDPLVVLRHLDGYYECPKNIKGKRSGPLVGYAGRYDAGNGVMKQYVGDVYANFAKAERRPRVIMTWAQMMEERLALLKPTVVMGMPMGGIVSAFAWAYVLDCDFVFPEKKVLELATTTGREKAILTMARHELRPGDRVLIGEDVCNNFATTLQAVNLVVDARAEVVGISCWLNRSAYRTQWEAGIPLEALVDKTIPECKQEDSEVAADIAVGNVVWKPKDNWDRLMSAMNAAETTVAFDREGPGVHLK